MRYLCCHVCHFQVSPSEIAQIKWEHRDFEPVNRAWEVLLAASIHHLVDFGNEKEETGQQTESHAYREFQLVLEQEKLQQKWHQVKQKENPELNH